MTDKRDKFEDRIFSAPHPAEGSAVEAAAHSVKQQQEIQDTLSKASEILAETSADDAVQGNKPFGAYCMEVDKAFHLKILPIFQARVTQLHKLTSHKGSIAVPLTIRDCWKLINDLESYLLMEVYNHSLSGVAKRADMTPEYEMARAVYLAVMAKEHNGRNPHAYKC